MTVFPNQDYKRVADSVGVFKPDEVDVLDEVLDESRGANPDEYYVIDEAVDGMLAGFCIVTRVPITSFVWDVCWIVVDKRFHGRGVGKSLIKKTEEFVLKQDDTAIIRIETSSKDEYLPARKLYLSQGYDEIFRYPNFYAKGDDMVTYSKEISRDKLFVSEKPQGITAQVLTTVNF